LPTEPNWKRGVPIPRTGRVSVVVVHGGGIDDTTACLEGIRGLAWPTENLEVIVVDNASGDYDVEGVLREFPFAQTITLENDLGFVAACNQGVGAATGEFVAFLSKAARPDPNWLQEAVTVLRRDGTVACVASKVLDWEGKHVDFVEAAMAFYGYGIGLHQGEPDSPEYERETDVLFASGTAMVLRTDVYREVGGFDDRFLRFFEDVDLGWRLWILGYRVRYVPTSLVYHRRRATSSQHEDGYEHYMRERNALFTVFKNYADENLGRALPAALMLAVRRGVALGGDDPDALGGQTADEPKQPASIELDARTVGSAFAINAVVEALPELSTSRRAIQMARRRGDQELRRLFKNPMFADIDDPYFIEGFSNTVEALGVKDMFARKRRILVATSDVLEERMAGPAIRAWQIASALSREHDVELVTTSACSLSDPSFRVRKVTARDFPRAVDWCDVMIVQGHMLRWHPVLRYNHKVVVVDLYDPFHLEVLEQARDQDPPDRLFLSRASTEVLNEQLERGDFFLCASAKQRDFWLGQLAAVGRINPVTYDRDERLDTLINVVPFGISDEPPKHTRPVLRGIVPGIGPDDKVILWGGGVYNWFDPLTLLRAVDKLRGRIENVRLYFLGLRHPNPDVGEMRMTEDAIALADELGLTGTHVFFNRGWVPYEDRQSYLLEATIGVSTHLDHVETAFSFRTRVLDYLWASLPIVATAGDSLADVIEAEGIGLTVRAGDIDALEDALFRLIDDEGFNTACRNNLTRVAPKFQWSVVLRPLLEFCRDPVRAPDLADPETAAVIASPLRGRVWPHHGWRADLRKAIAYVQAGDLRFLAEKVRNRFRQRSS
jgi:GT2 family glycosyltransferase/glycosyltransferase involved in cell wall biosynthesis